MAELTIDKRAIMHDCLEQIRQQIIANIDSHGLKASGKTQKSLEIVEQGESMLLVGRPYFQSLEIGRPAGAVPGNFHAIIRQWIIDKKIAVRQIPYKTNRPHKYSVEERSLNMAVGAICHTIATRGTKLYRNGGDPTVYSTVIQPEVDKMKQAIAVGIINMIKNELK